MLSYLPLKPSSNSIQHISAGIAAQSYSSLKYGEDCDVANHNVMAKVIPALFMSITMRCPLLIISCLSVCNSFNAVAYFNAIKHKIFLIINVDDLAQYQG